MAVDKSFEGFLESQIIIIFDSFLNNLKDILQEQNSFSQEEREKILEELSNVIESISPYQDTLKPKIKDKINQIKHLLEPSNEVYDLNNTCQVSPKIKDK